MSETEDLKTAETEDLMMLMRSCNARMMMISIQTKALREEIERLEKEYAEEKERHDEAFVELFNR